MSSFTISLNHSCLCCAVSQLEVQNMKVLNGTSSSDTKTSKNLSEAVVFQDTSASSSLDQYTQAARMSLKMQRVKDKLDSMLVSHLASNVQLFDGYLIN